MINYYHATIAKDFLFGINYSIHILNLEKFSCYFKFFKALEMVVDIFQQQAVRE